jgi:hypothetical protein
MNAYEKPMQKWENGTKISVIIIIIETSTFTKEKQLKVMSHEAHGLSSQA